MASDRMIHWKREDMPTQAQVETALRNYVGEGGVVEWRADRYYVTLPGNQSPALRGHAGLTPAKAAYFEEIVAEKRERGFEVWRDETTVDVITREQDDFVRALAEGFAQVMTYGYRGSRE